MEAAAFSRSPPIPIKKTLVIVNDFIISTTKFLNHFSTLAEEKLLKVSHDIERIETSLILLESRLSRIPGMEDPVLPPPTALTTAIHTTKPLPSSLNSNTTTSSSSTASSSSSATPSSSSTGTVAPYLPPPEQVLALPSIPTSTNTNTMVPPSIPAQPVMSSLPPPPPPPPPPVPAVVVQQPTLPPVVPVPAPAPPPAPAVMTVEQDPTFAKFFKMMRMGVPSDAVKHKMIAEGLEPSYLDKPNAPSPYATAVVLADI